MGKRRGGRELLRGLSKKQKKHLREFGEQHPFHDKVPGRPEATQVCELSDNSDKSSAESDSETEVEQVSVYHKLLATLKTSPESESEEEEEDESESEAEGSETEMDSEGSLEIREADGGEDQNDVPEQEEATDMAEQMLSQQQADGIDTSCDPSHGVIEEFTDVKHESEFSLETNFMEEESGDCNADKRDGSSSQAFSEDPFKQHMDKELDEKDVEKMSTLPKTSSQSQWPRLGQVTFSSALEKAKTLKADREVDVKQLYLHKPLESTWPKVNKQFLSSVNKPSDAFFTPLQRELFCIMNTYRDLFYPERNALTNGEEIRHAYCLHALNHVLKANSQVLSNNAKKRNQKPGTDNDDHRDQGLTRPKVLIIVPFRECALRIVHLFISLLEVNDKRKIDVSNKKRFKGEFGSDPEEKPPNLKRPEDYEAVFAGNIDDHFRIGVAILQKSMRLYAPFYSSDIIIASPLGMRTVIGAEGEKKRDFDFLSSIEILIIDQADIYLMQNWEHVLILAAFRTCSLEILVFGALVACFIRDYFLIGLIILPNNIMMIPLITSERKYAQCLSMRNLYILIRVLPESDRSWGLSPLTAETHLMKHMNLLPLDSHGVDFSRVRMLNLNNWCRYYRQTLLFSALQDPQVNSVFNKHCFNYMGQVAVRNVPLSGSISHVVVQLPHVFRRLEAESLTSVIDTRFQFFIDKVLPEYRDAIMSHTLIYIPSYFDYVRLRNYFKKEELNFTHICEYTKKAGVCRARRFFLKGEKQFLLFTERFHFYKRYTIKGIRNLIFYELPTYSHFYSEICNMMKATDNGVDATWTCTVLYSKYDAQKLAAVVGIERAAQMLQSKKNVHLFVTGESE